ncbi:MAG: type I restriction endonuclease subunit R [Firmicutes bacterium]|nr:type I restriction endonuclease subunit R [Bacillota bacterium]
MGLLNYTEDSLIEQPAIDLLRALGWQTIHCYHETFPAGLTGRETSAEVVLIPRLRAALERLNPELPAEALNQALGELIRDRSTMSIVRANQDVYGLLRDGVRVKFKNTEGEETVAVVRVIDWNDPARNDFLLASQLWVSSEMYKRRADLVGFVNGLPLVFFELKAAHKNLRQAYDGNLTDYKDTIPHLFWYNAFIILSNGSEAKVGSVTAEWEHFADWKRIDDEDENPSESMTRLEIAVRGLCEPRRLLDLVENFILFDDARGGLRKLIAKNHQYFGVNNAIRAVEHIRENQGRLGVFWHTQGSGKSYSMVFFTRKILRKLPGNWTFLVVTDRQELDDQIYKNFANAGAVGEPEERVRAGSGEHLKRLLTEDHRILFTLIHKFHCPPGTRYPVISQRSDIIVIADEAHRSQYDILAANMRAALPNAAFIAFTGTPLMAGEEKTREVFGEYVSIYDFKQSTDDGATVPLYYENRIPELQLINEDMDDDLNRLLEEAELSEEQEKRLEREFARQYHLITREDRLETIARDVVAHFMGRGDLTAKAMFVAIDRFTAVRMYDKVRKHWAKYLADLRKQCAACPAEEREDLDRRIAFMQETDMAVVVSQSQNEIRDFREKGLDIATHRRRMATEELDTRFKNPDDPFRLVFVCAMWITGFDVPSLSTIYLDKPMKNHTLMQTIARANRVFGDKTNGLIVDYVGVFRNLQKALAIYAVGGRHEGGETPVKEKSHLVALLQQAIEEAREFCAERGVDLEPILRSEGLQKVKFLDDAVKHLVDLRVIEAVADSVEKILMNDDLKKKYLSLANNVERLYKAILPDPDAHEYAAVKTLLVVIADKIRSLAPETDIRRVMRGVEHILDESIAAEGYVIYDPHGVIDLSKIDFEALRQHFEKTRKRTLTEQLRAAVAAKLEKMVRLNKTRIELMEKFQKMIEEYNAGSKNVEWLFDELLAFVKRLKDEEQRAVREELSEEELTIFDLLTKPEINLTEKERNEVKKVARDLLETLKREKLVLDWRKRQETRAQVLVTIQDVLDKGLPRVYTKAMYDEKVREIYQHVYDSYYGQGRGVYATA